MKVALTLLVIAVLLLHQDTWTWTNKNLVFGFLPAGLAYHAFFSLLAAATMAVASASDSAIGFSIRICLPAAAAAFACAA